MSVFANISATKLLCKEENKEVECQNVAMY